MLNEASIHEMAITLAALIVTACELVSGAADALPGIPAPLDGVLEDIPVDTMGGGDGALITDMENVDWSEKVASGIAVADPKEIV